LVAEVVVTCDAAFSVFRPGVVDISGDRITWVGSVRTAPPAPDRVVRLNGLLMPGLVNCHSHSPMTLLRGVGEGLPLERWLREAIWPREANLTAEDVYWGMALACDELLRCGVTTSCETYFHNPSVVDAVVDAGMRCLVTPGIIDLPEGGPDWSWQHLLSSAVELHANASGRGGLVEVGFGPHAAYSLPPEALTEIAAKAQERSALVHVHVAETAHEVRAIEEQHGCRVPELLFRLGVLEARVLAAHSVWLDDGDIEMYRRHDVAVAHCPQSNAKLGSGIARLGDMLAADLRVGLGTDGPASNNDLDLWEEMRLAPLLARATSGDATLISAPQAISLATRCGADALGIPTGALETGRLADLVHLDLDDARFTPVVDQDDLVSHLLWSSSSRLVTDVWVGGRQVVHDGRCLTVDDAEARRQVQHRAERLAGAVGRR
jgi:5-methylthioadenosine/S-adenosylhomocysteine deaminase